MKKLAFILVLFLMIMADLIGQRNIENIKDYYKLGIHVNPIMFSNKCRSSGIGFEKPLTNKILAGVDIGYIYFSFLDLWLVNSSGVHISPYVLTFFKEKRGFSGISIGLKPQFLWYKSHKNEWQNVSNTGEFSSFTYLQNRDINAQLLQSGLAASFGIRGIRLGSKIYFRLMIDMGVLYSKMKGYEEDLDISDNISPIYEELVFPFNKQNNGFQWYSQYTIGLGYAFTNKKPEISF